MPEKHLNKCFNSHKKLFENRTVYLIRTTVNMSNNFCIIVLQTTGITTYKQIQQMVENSHHLKYQNKRRLKETRLKEL